MIYMNGMSSRATTGAFQTTFGGRGYDAFVTRLNDTGSALVHHARSVRGVRALKCFVWLKS
jgi:hypothetical protein